MIPDEIQAAADQATARGYTGQRTDRTPDEHYSGRRRHGRTAHTVSARPRGHQLPGRRDRRQRPDMTCGGWV